VAFCIYLVTESGLAATDEPALFEIPQEKILTKCSPCRTLFEALNIRRLIGDMAASTASRD
jgi:hypothetical protein